MVMAFSQPIDPEMEDSPRVQEAETMNAPE